MVCCFLLSTLAACDQESVTPAIVVAEATEAPPTATSTEISLINTPTLKPSLTETPVPPTVTSTQTQTATPIPPTETPTATATPTIPPEPDFYKNRVFNK